MTKKKKIIIISIVALVIVLIGGGSYAWFNYYKVSDLTNLLVAGDISLKLEEGEDTLVLTNVFPETKEEARSHDGNVLTFSVNGSNGSSKAILYNILLNHGNIKSGKTRFSDDELRFDLIEIVNNNEVYLVEAASFSTLSDTSIYDNIVPANTNSVSHTYKIRVWVDEGVTISETVTGNHIYTPNAYKNLYATVKIAVKGENIEGTKYTVTFDANGGTVGISSKDVIQGQKYGFLPTPTKEGYTFMGWNGKNLFDSSKLLKAYGWAENNGEYSGDVRYLYETYSPSYGGEYIHTDFKPSTIYCLSFYTKNATTSGGVKFYFGYVEEGVEGSSSSVTSNTTDYGNYTLKSKTGQSIKGLSISYNSRQTVWLKEIQLEEGTEATAYEPYYITSNTNVVQEQNHTLKAIWQENT